MQSMQKMFLWVSFMAATLVYGSILVPPTVYADTHINSGFLFNDTVWEASSSPYILGDDLTVPAGHS